MEIVLQYLDDLDDLVGTVGLLAEKIRGLTLLSAFFALSVVLQLAAVWAAIMNPPLALAAALALCVALVLNSQPRPAA